MRANSEQRTAENSTLGRFVFRLVEVRRRVLPIMVVAAGLVLQGSPGKSPKPARAQVNNAAVKQAIARGVAYLKERAGKWQGGEPSLAAYAMLKGGASPDDPGVAKVIEKIAARAQNGQYKPIMDSKAIYGAGVDMMALEAADKKKYKPEMTAIANFIVKNQYPGGHWDYLEQAGQGRGDTSVTQYAVLGLWAAERAGITIPLQVWDKAANWHVTRQSKNGGWVYHPSPGGNGGTHPMTTAGVGSLLVCRRYLYPNAEQQAEQKQKQQKQQTKKKFGVLEQVDLDQTPAEEQKAAKKDPVNYNPRTPAGQINRAIRAGLNWLATRYTIRGGSEWPNYYLYGLERTMALANLQTLGGHDWYAEGSAHILKQQKEDGSWSSRSGQLPATSFCVLFLSRATAKMLNRPTKPLSPIGDGLLAGGRGLPENLAHVEVEDGKVKTKKLSGPLSELLAELENPQSVNVEAAQQAIVEKIQVGSREKLIGQKDRLKTLLQRGNAEVRRTALWALGRTGDLRLASLMIEALKDPNVDVAVEARNALCVLSRRPDGFGLPETPLQGLPAEASEKQKQEAIRDWQQKVYQKWSQWYQRVQPYDVRNLPEKPETEAAF